MIYFIPYLNFEVKSSLKLEELVNKFSLSVTVLKTLSLTKTNIDTDFEGVLNDEGFSFRRRMKIGYSAFLPIFSCKIIEEENDLRLTCAVRFHNQVNIGLLLFFLFQISIFSFNFISITILVIPYLIILYLFNLESKALKEQFHKIIGRSPNEGNL